LAAVLGAVEVCSSTKMGALGASHLGMGDHGPKTDRSRPRSVLVNALVFTNRLSLAWLVPLPDISNNADSVKLFLERTSPLTPKSVWLGLISLAQCR
jgi:hypothetical protein